MSDPTISVQSLCKKFVTGDTEVEVLRDISTDIESGHFVCVLGASGAGKTTLLHILGTLLRPTSGKIFYNGRDVFKSSERELIGLRNRLIGFVFQFHHLLPEFSAQENVAMPLLIRRTAPDEALRKADSLLERVGLGHRLRHRPCELSFGEQQRVAVARALVGDPDVILADEPTGNLDQETGRQIFSLLTEMTVSRGKVLVVVTHNLELASSADQVLKIGTERHVSAQP
ncbi:ABC transporter ATP-binding protein [bacterium]|nr:ABC transporter ATP-binding protein [bacterium]